MSQSEDSEAVASHLVLAQTVILRGEFDVEKHHLHSMNGEV